MPIMWRSKKNISKRCYYVYIFWTLYRMAHITPSYSFHQQQFFLSVKLEWHKQTKIFLYWNTVILFTFRKMSMFFLLYIHYISLYTTQEFNMGHLSNTFLLLGIKQCVSLFFLILFKIDKCIPTCVRLRRMQFKW